MVLMSAVVEIPVRNEPTFEMKITVTTVNSLVLAGSLYRKKHGGGRKIIQPKKIK